MKADLKALLAKLTNTPIIVEQGTDGIWTYRKWSNGTAECWGTKGYTATSFPQWGSIYYGEPYTSFYTAYPTNLFIDTPSVTGEITTAGGDLWLVKASTAANKNRTPEWYPARAASIGSIGFYISYHAIGRWK